MMTVPNALPYGGALDAVRRIETALTERNAADDTAEAELALAHEQAEQLLAAARAAGKRTGRDRHDAVLAEADAEVRAIHSRGEAEVKLLDERVSRAREVLVAELTALLLIEEA